jgi:serine/threonine-protein kinase
MGSVEPNGGSGTEEHGDARIGMVLQDRYRILSCLAGGGMGTVYQAERLQLGRQVAVKFLHDAVIRDPSVLKRFELEAHAMSRLSHPNCVSVFDFGVAGSPYLVMDLVTGQTLRAAIDEGVLPASRALRIARQVLAGLSHAHAQGIVHRDIKPDNIIVEQTPGLEDHVRILDFGLAKMLNSQADLTRGVVLGTPNYMAPEQLGEGTVDERTDVYAVGIVLFEMLTGQKPFRDDDVMEVFRRQLRMPPPPLRRTRPQGGYSAALEAVILRAMAKSQAERFATAAALSAALDALPEAGRPPQAPSSPADPAFDATVHSTPHEEAGSRGALTPAPHAPAEQARVAVDVKRPARPGSRALATLTDLVRRLGRRGFDGIHAGGTGLGRGLAWLARPRRRRTKVDRALSGLRRVARRRPVQVGAVCAGVLVPLLAIVAHNRDAPQNGQGLTPPMATTPVLEPPASSEAVRGSSEVKQLIRAGDRERALRRLADLRRDNPDDAELAGLQARLFFEKLWWSEGVAAYRVALRSDPARAGDPALVASVIRALQSPRFHPTAAAFLRELGEPARPFVEQAARDHEIPSVRARAGSLLEAWPSPRL